ncbi:MAG: PLP-dependent aminotransferase family protein [Chloroflexi bacterium]|nr:PLP-dependent aminotransferase family protein [Chloroflexota bacterium]
MSSQPPNSDPLAGVQAGGPPGTIPFVYGHPDPALLPVEQIAEAAAQAMGRAGGLALQYGPEQGYGPLMDYLLAKTQRDEGLRLERAQMMFSAGAAQALDMIARRYTRPGDVVVVEGPTYHEAIATLRDYPIELRQVPCDDHGLRTDLLAERLAAWVAQGQTPRLLYVIPSFQNPSGATLTLARRQELVSLARQYGIWIVEDDVYRDLPFQAAAPPSLFALSGGEGVLRLGSFSKILAPGLRLGWIIAPPPAIQRLVTSGLKGNEGGSSPLSAHIAYAFCRNGWLEPHLKRLRDGYRTRRDALLAALADQMPPGVCWNRPAGGFFIWVRLPQPLRTQDVLAAARRRLVTFAPGQQFFAQEGGEREFRLPFSYVSPEQMREGCAVLGEVIRSLR